MPSSPDSRQVTLPAPRRPAPRHRDNSRSERVTSAEVEPRLPPGQLQALLDSSPDLIARYGRDGTRLFVNRALAELLGRPAREIVGTHPGEPGAGAGCGQGSHWSDPLLAGIRRAFDSGQLVEVETAHLCGGRTVIVHFRLVPETDPQGRVVDVLGIGQDITAVKQIEQDLYESRRRYRDVFDNALDQMILLEICPQGRFRILEINPAMERAMPYGREQIIGRFQDELYSPEVDRALTACYQACIEAGSPVESELELDLPDGRRLYRATTVPARDETGHIIRVVNIARDVTERRAEEDVKQRLERALRTLSSGNETLVRASDEGSLLAGMARVMVEVGGHRRSWIGCTPTEVPLTGRDAADVPVAPGWSPLPVTPVAWASADVEEAARAEPDRAWLGPPEPLLAALRSGRAQLCHPALGDGPWEPLRETARRLEIESCLTMPLVHDGQVLGVFVVHAATLDAFGPDELQLLTELSADLAYGIHNVRARAEQDRHEERLLKAMNATVQALADTTELRDPYTAGHQRRVAQLAEAVGRRLGLSEDRVAGLYLASTIHDIGKISVPAEILGRPGKLSALEYAMVQQHVAAAYEVLRGIEFPWPVADIVAQHHERCDGSGYPAGLRSEELLLEARILAVCDVVEAMWSHRPYRAGLGMEAALAELEAHRGDLYDADVVDACVGMLREGGFQFS